VGLVALAACLGVALLVVLGTLQHLLGRLDDTRTELEVLRHQHRSLAEQQRTTQARLDRVAMDNTTASVKADAAVHAAQRAEEAALNGKKSNPTKT
jgi:hypothetical protein